MLECFGFNPCSKHKDLVWLYVLGQGRLSKCEIIPPDVSSVFSTVNGRQTAGP